MFHVKNLLYFAGVLQMMQTRIAALQSTVDRYDIHYAVRKYKFLGSIILFINTAINNFLLLFLELKSKLLTPTTK